MPLNRLSIKSALILAQGAVSLHRLRGVADLWFTRTRYGAGAEGAVAQSPAEPRLGAKGTRKERRVFVALQALGLEPVLAMGLAVKAKSDSRDWRKLVALYVEQNDLGG